MKIAIVMIMTATIAGALSLLAAKAQPDKTGWRQLRPDAMHWLAVALGVPLTLLFAYNPHAKIPLDPDLIPGASHLFLQNDGQIVSESPDLFPFGSTTQNIAPIDVGAVLKEFDAGTHFVWTPREE